MRTHTSSILNGRSIASSQINVNYKLIFLNREFIRINWFHIVVIIVTIRILPPGNRRIAEFQKLTRFGCVWAAAIMRTLFAVISRTVIPYKLGNGYRLLQQSFHPIADIVYSFYFISLGARFSSRPPYSLIPHSRIL